MLTRLADYETRKVRRSAKASSAGVGLHQDAREGVSRMKTRMMIRGRDDLARRAWPPRQKVVWSLSVALFQRPYALNDHARVVVETVYAKTGQDGRDGLERV